jgi:hypothetical protein
MWAKYSYNASVSQANILNDIVAILTGTTDKTTLSAGCDQANTEILTTYDNAGWTVHDAAAGTNAQVIKAACQGDANQYKYVEINTNTAGQVFMGFWEDWNAGTHTGTNLTNNSKTTGYGQRYSTTTVGTMYISASSGRVLMYGTSSAGDGTANGGKCTTGVLESGRNYTWCAVGQGYVPAFYLLDSSTTHSPRYKTATGGIQTSGSVISGLKSTFGASSGGTVIHSTGVPGSSGNNVPVADFTVNGNTTNQAYFSDVLPSGAKCAGIGNALDELSYDSKTWIIMPMGTSASISTLMVPKG